MNLFVAVDSVLAPSIDEQIGAVIPAGVGTAGSLRVRTYAQRYTGSAGSWDVSHRVSA